MEKASACKYIDPVILKRYIEGHGNRKDRERIREWFSQLRANEEIRMFIHDLWDHYREDESLTGYEEDRIHDRIHHILRAEDAAEMQKERAKTRFIRHFQRIAAILILPLALFSMVYYLNHMSADQHIASSVIHSPLGTRTSFSLPDGTTGWLNGDSYLELPTRFQGKERAVTLVGEAYFSVSKNPDKPFTVNTDQLKVKVYGTSFNIMAYTDETTTEVALESGKIEVFTQASSGIKESRGIMTPGNVGILWKGSDLFQTEPAIIDQHTSWKEGKLVFRNELMPQVVNKINRWYNVNIIIKDSRLNEYTYVATFIDETLDEVLKIFQATSPVAFKDLGRKIHSDSTYGKRTIEMYYSPN